MKTVPSLTYFLEMKESPGIINTKLPKGFHFELLQNPDPEEYIRIYRMIGFKWKWYDRILMDKTKLIKIIQSPETKIYTLNHSNEIAGFAELNTSEKGSIEIVYLGIKDGYIGKGLGKALINNVLHAGWNLNPDRIWLHTCEYDHPGALKFYERCGFEVYREELLTQVVL